MNIFVELLNKQYWGNFFFVIEPKQKMFLENRSHTFLDIVKRFTKTKFQINFT